MEARVESLYKNSWISKYYIFDVKVNNGFVFFHLNTKDRQEIVDQTRFTVFIYVPKLTKPFFFPYSHWKYLTGTSSNSFVECSLISNIPNAFPSKSYPSAKSLFYASPFFFYFKTSDNVKANYLSFNNFFKPNTENRILAMVDFNENSNNFEPVYFPEIILPYTKTPSLNNLLEFSLFDAKQKQITVLDYSQIFVVISVL